MTFRAPLVASGNFVGLSATGTAAIPNGNENFASHFFYPACAIFNGAQNNVIGGTSAGASNVISGNTAQGIVIADAGTNGNAVRGNLIGVNPTGDAALGNGFADPPNNFRYAGVSIFGGAQTNTLSANIISGNAAQGLTISDSGTNANVVQGNLIGTNTAGSAAIANGFEGIAVFGGAQSNLIGGTTVGTGNVISGNLARGVGFFDAATTNNSVQGNLIGLNTAGTTAIANSFSGVECYLASNNTIGGTNPGARNYISGNSDRGVLLDGSAATGNKVIGNTIGLTKSGAAVPNGTQGVALFTGAHGNFIGGSLAGESNVISANSQEGIALYDASTIANTISRNSIYSNQSIGIGRYTGSNNNQPAPVLSSATLSPSGNADGMNVSGSIAGAATLEFYASPPGGDEGQFFLGTFNAPGGSFSVAVAATAPASYVITVTATASGSTSQFSNTAAVAAVDTDGDGLPDNWMVAHFGHADPRAIDLSRANDDADGDGLTNLEELRAGTDPRSAASGLRVISVTRNGGDVSLVFSSVAGKTYLIESRDSFLRGNWTLLTDQVIATGAMTTMTDFGAASVPQRVYRISVEP